MSVIIGAHLGRYVLFGTDTRSVVYDETLTTIRRTRDGHQKLKAGAMGLMTGSGATKLLDGVMARFPEATTVQGLLDVIAAEQQAFWAKVPPHLRDFSGACTGWMVTYRTPAAGLRLGVYHPANGHAFFSVVPGTGISFAPPCPGEEELRQSTHEELNEVLQDGLRRCGPDEPIEASVQYHMQLFRSVLAEYARRIPQTVSRDTMIGVHTEADEISIGAFPPLVSGVLDTESAVAA